MTLAARNVKEDIVALIMGSGGVCVYSDPESDGRFCVDAFDRNLASVEFNLGLYKYVL
jgi:hypothetical protein